MHLAALTSLVLLIVTFTTAPAEPPPCSCLQEIWVDYPGPYDVYVSLNKQYSCNESGSMDLWFGAPQNTNLPQNCENNECEVWQSSSQSFASTLPGHGQELVGPKAWDVFRVGLESARRKMPGLEFDKPLYHRIPRLSLPKSLASAGNMIVMAIPITVHVNGSRLDGKTYYLCAQLDSAEGLPITAATFETGREGPGSQLHITYRVRDDVRKGLVWLK